MFSLQTFYKLNIFSTPVEQNFCPLQSKISALTQLVCVSNQHSCIFFTMSSASLCLSFSKIRVLLSSGNGAYRSLPLHLNKFSLSTITFNSLFRSFNLLLSLNIFWFILIQSFSAWRNSENFKKDLRKLSLFYYLQCSSN